MIKGYSFCSWLFCLLCVTPLEGLQSSAPRSTKVECPLTSAAVSSRRSWLSHTLTVTAAAIITANNINNSNDDTVALAASSAGPPPDLKFVETPLGIKYADAKVGTGQPITAKGTPITIDYVMSTTGARYGTKIYSTQDKNVPYRFALGDGTTIEGLELAIAGDAANNLEPMRPGGIRRVIIPAKYGYASLAQPLAGLQYQDCQEGKGVGPIPPTDEGTTGEYYQRFKNIYCNANRPYQPDLVMDVKLYGKR